MLLFIILFIVINQVNGDMAPVLIQPDNVFDEDKFIPKKSSGIVKFAPSFK